VALKGEEFAHLDMALNTVMLDYPEPNLIEEALKTHDAEHRKACLGH